MARRISVIVMVAGIILAGLALSVTRGDFSGGNAAPAVSGLGVRTARGTTAITVHAVTDPAPPGATAAPAGTRFVAVDVTLEHTGATPTPYDLYGAMLMTTDDRLYHAVAPVGMTAHPPLLYGVIAPGERIRGWVFFTIPAGAHIAAFRYQYAASGPVIVTL